MESYVRTRRDQPQLRGILPMVMMMKPRTHIYRVISGSIEVNDILWENKCGD